MAAEVVLVSTGLVDTAAISPVEGSPGKNETIELDADATEPGSDEVTKGSVSTATDISTAEKLPVLEQEVG